VLKEKWFFEMPFYITFALVYCLLFGFIFRLSFYITACVEGLGLGVV